MYILQILQHSPESCPLGRPENLEVMKNWVENVEAIAAKHDVKVVSIWTDRWGHTSWVIYEAQSMEAFAKFELEPENLRLVTFNHVETRRVTSAKETLAFFRNHQKENKK